MKERIVIACSRLDAQGGIERASVNLAHLFYANGHAVTLLILDFTAALFYEVDKGINIVQKNLHFGITEKGSTLTKKLQFLKHVRELNSIYKSLNADVIISTEYSITVPTVLATGKLNVLCLGWEHHHFYWLEKSWFWQKLFLRTYPKLNAVVCQNQTEKGLYEKIGCKSFVIPYVVPVQERSAELGNKIILTIGWLIKRKGVDMLPAVAQKVFAAHPDWHWKIIGEGEEYDQLLAAIKEKGLEKRITIQKPGSPNIAEEYLAASLFVLLSRFECLPLVMLEATTFGLPTIAFDCPTGPADIIHNNEDGYLIKLEDADAMASAIIALIEDESKRKSFGKIARQSSHRYAPETIYQQWMELFQQLKTNPA